MSQIEDLRKGHSDHEDRLSRLENFLNPIMDEQQKYQQAAAAQDFLSEDNVVLKKTEPDDSANATGTPPPPDPQTGTPEQTTETNPEGGMAMVAGHSEPSVSEEVKEETGDATN